MFAALRMCEHWPRGCPSLS